MVMMSLTLMATRSFPAPEYSPCSSWTSSLVPTPSHPVTMTGCLYSLRSNAAAKSPNAPWSLRCCCVLLTCVPMSPTRAAASRVSTPDSL